MIEQICQSCGIPLQQDSNSTNANSTRNNEYCMYCSKDGAFTSADLTLKDQVNKLAEMAVKKFGVSEEEALQNAKTILPKLKRWK